jgi:hypothetical protein
MRSKDGRNTSCSVAAHDWPHCSPLWKHAIPFSACICRPRHVHRRYVLAGATHKAPRPLAAADAVRQVQLPTKLQYMQLQYLWARTTPPTSGQRSACSSSRNSHRSVEISHSLRLNIFRAAMAHIKTHPQQSIHRHAARGIAQIPGICRRTLRKDCRISDTARLHSRKPTLPAGRTGHVPSPWLCPGAPRQGLSGAVFEAFIIHRWNLKKFSIDPGFVRWATGRVPSCFMTGLRRGCGA